MIQKLTVIGGGATGHGVAAVMASKGLSVTLYDDERFAERFQKIEELGGIEVRGRVHLIGKPDRVTTDVKEAVSDADAIFVHVMSDRHEEIARKIAPYLHDGQHIVIFPGNLGSFVFRRVFEELHVTADVTVSEKEGNFFPCRLSGDAEVTVGMPLNLKGRIASLPSKDTPRVIEALKPILDYAPNQNVLEGAMNAGNVIMHIASTLLSSAEIQHKGKAFSLFKYAFTPAAVSCASAIREERLAVMQAIGMPEHANQIGFIKKIQEIDANPELKVFYEHMDGPYALDHRYIHEDCGCGGALISSVGKRSGIKTPVLDSFITIAGAINHRDYFGKDGRTLEALGFAPELSYEEINKQI